MTLTTTPESLKQENWSKDFWTDYQKASEFKKSTGNDHNKPIQYLDKTGKTGSAFTVNIIGQDDDDGKSGHDILSGNETVMDQFSHTVNSSIRRKAYALDEQTKEESAFEQMQAVRPLLKDWCQNMQRKDIIDSLGMVSNQKTFNTPMNSKRCTQSTDLERDTWLTANEDRVLFGNDWGNTVTGDASASMAVVNVADDPINARALMRMKARAETMENGIFPTQIKDGNEFYVYYMPTVLFDDLTVDDVIMKINTESRPRDINKHPLFNDGDLLFKGIIIKRVPKIQAVSGVGAAGIDLWPSFFCGRQAVAIIQKSLPKPTKRNEDDYGHVDGRGITEALGINKIQRNNGTTLVDHGVLSAFHASPNTL